SVQNLKKVGPGVEHLAELPHLTSLWLAADSASEINDDVLKIVSEKLPNLTTLKLEATKLTDGGLSCLNRLHKLRKFSIAFSTKITDKGMIYIAPLNLKSLNVNGTELTNQGLKTLSEMKGLEMMFFWHTLVTDAGMPDLAKIKTLRVLHLTH